MNVTIDINSLNGATTLRASIRDMSGNTIEITDVQSTRASLTNIPVGEYLAVAQLLDRGTLVGNEMTYNFLIAPETVEATLYSADLNVTISN